MTRKRNRAARISCCSLGTPPMSGSGMVPEPRFGDEVMVADPVFDATRNPDQVHLSAQMSP